MDKKTIIIFSTCFLVIGILLLSAGVLVGRLSHRASQGSSARAPSETAPTSKNADTLALAAQHVGQAQGIDVSHYQGLVQWPMVKKAGIMFAFAKATGGTSFVDPEFANNWHGMREVHLLRGAYHFFYANIDPVAQADHFINTVGALQPHGLPPMLDVERREDVSPSTLVKNVLIWLQHVESKLGKKPILYASADFYKRFLQGSFNDYPLWVAAYQVASPPNVGHPWDFWQYSSQGRVNGINGSVDLDRFNGTPQELVLYVNRGTLNTYAGLEKSKSK